jgi:hypothetical protein
MHVFLISALVGEWLASRPGLFTAGENFPKYPLGRRMCGPKIGLDDVQLRKLLNLLGVKLRPLGRPVRSQPTALSRLNGMLQREIMSWVCNTNGKGEKFLHSFGS